MSRTRLRVKLNEALDYLVDILSMKIEEVSGNSIVFLVFCRIQVCKQVIYHSILLILFKQ